MQEVEACPFCGASTHFSLYRKTVKAEENTDGYQRYILGHVLGGDAVATKMRFCCTCMALFLSPRFDKGDLRRLYGPEYAEERRRYDVWWRPPDPEILEQIESSEADRREVISEVLGSMADKARSVLDYGSGQGTLIPRLPRLERAYVYDKFVQEAVEGVERIEDPSVAAPYDLVMCTHVLEHVANPRGFSRKHEIWRLPMGSSTSRCPTKGCVPRLHGAESASTSTFSRLRRYRIWRAPVRCTSSISSDDFAPTPFGRFTSSMPYCAKGRGRDLQVSQGWGLKSVRFYCIGEFSEASATKADIGLPAELQARPRDPGSRTAEVKPRMSCMGVPWLAILTGPLAGPPLNKCEPRTHGTGRFEDDG